MESHVLERTCLRYRRDSHHQQEAHRVCSEGSLMSASAHLVTHSYCSIVRASIGAMTTEADLQALLLFLHDTFIMGSEPMATSQDKTLALRLPAPHEARTISAV